VSPPANLQRATMRKLLLVDDDQTLAMLLQNLLAQHGFDLVWADRPSKGLLLLADRPELVLLDVMLPEQDGFEVCRQMRASGVTTPVIMLTGRGDDTDRIRGLNLGADDYVPKPFNHLELIARVEAVLRRRPQTLETTDCLDHNRKTLLMHGRSFPLTRTEYRILEILTEQLGRTYSRSDMLARMDDSGGMETFDRAIDIHISRLRSKIERDPRRPRHLLTVRGFGYRFQW
jgi:two-component system phosphate regulon response regulator OmpR